MNSVKTAPSSLKSVYVEKFIKNVSMWYSPLILMSLMTCYKTRITILYNQIHTKPDFWIEYCFHFDKSGSLDLNV